ncbi:CDP-glycerol glycerophosphotransferase family protein [Streptomyces sp. ME19-01-6]|uniref:CDP-glycerol glycerophosphotransferase family protein n=1 Tax=Streptomyces sp. ME19-01-6 TaxID=3028686 RepID=UPI0029A94DF7|nr:CDP-glycerol glycerophosphotransferase family protein [Streptomyces sp. ME19-01-6]MDX3230959.1 CDP-glycerol glycerophosphotransferase family protein [Streptomyces sp. ME19-01-6]
MARTVTSTVRVLDVLAPVLRDDPRVHVVFGYDPTSAFSDGVSDLLRAHGARVMPWDQLARIPCDLIVTATENADLSGTDAPVLVLPHGVGFHKLVPDARGPHDRVSGLVPEGLLDRAWLTISHPDQAGQLAALHPGTVGRTLLVGDPCYDELLCSRDLRARYREALGVAEDQRLVMLSSTWRTQSLLGRHPDLPARLLAELPLDEYRVALITHPNVVSAHGSWGLRTDQTSAREAGLLLIPPTAGWQATLIAADVLIGDHGSVTFYGAALGKPVILAAFGDESIPGTPMAELGRIAPRLTVRAGSGGRPTGPGRPYGQGGHGLYEQVERAIADHEPARLAKIGAAAFADPGQALARLRTDLYALLRLPEPAAPPPPVRAFGDPLPDRQEVFSATVTTAVDGDTVAVRRFPASVAGVPDEAGHPNDPNATEETACVCRHLCCQDRERDRHLLESASVLTRHEPAATPTTAMRWAHETLHRYPGSLMAAAATARGDCLVALRDGRVAEASATGLVRDPGLLAAVVYGRLRAGRPLEGIVTLRVGGREEDVALRVRPVGAHD